MGVQQQAEQAKVWLAVLQAEKGVTIASQIYVAANNVPVVIPPPPALATIEHLHHHVATKRSLHVKRWVQTHEVEFGTLRSCW